MNEQLVSTQIDILGKSYPIRCLESEIEALQKAAAHLNEKMLNMQSAGKINNLERIAVMSALNITHDFLQFKKNQCQLIERLDQQIINLYNQIDATQVAQFDEVSVES